MSAKSTTLLLNTNIKSPTKMSTIISGGSDDGSFVEPLDNNKTSNIIWKKGRKGKLKLYYGFYFTKCEFLIDNAENVCFLYL